MFALKSLSDHELVSRLRSLVEKEKSLALEIVSHLVEVARRGLYLGRGYGSLYEYCTGELGYTDASAWRRTRAAQAILRCPEAWERLAEGRVTLCALGRVHKFITPNVLEEICEKSKTQVEWIAARYDAKGLSPDRTRPVMVPKPAEPTLSGLALHALSMSARGTMAAAGTGERFRGEVTVLSQVDLPPLRAEVSHGEQSDALRLRGEVSVLGQVDLPPLRGEVGSREQPEARRLRSEVGHGEQSNGPGLRGEGNTSNEETPSLLRGGVATGVRSEQGQLRGEVGSLGGTEAHGLRSEVVNERGERQEFEQKWKIEAVVSTQVKAKLDRCKSLLSRKYPRGVDYDTLFGELAEVFLERLDPERKNERREQRKANVLLAIRLGDVAGQPGCLP